MRAIWLTDIHLNFIEDENVSEWLNSLRTMEFDAVWISGDIGEANSIEKYPVDVPEPPPYPDKTFKKK